MIELNFRNHIPIYMQIVERVKRLIETEVIQAGDQLPTVRQLATDLSVNFNTIARAYRILDELGVVSTQQGRGTYVVAAMSPQRAEQLKESALEELTRSLLEEAARMGFAPADVERVQAALIKEWRSQSEQDED